jgi:Putative transposase
MTLTADEFLRRFLLHVLPSGLVRMRHFGFLANRHRTASLALCRTLLKTTLVCAVLDSDTTASACRRCPLCSGEMHTLERLTSQQAAFALADWNRRVDTS